MAEQPPIPAEVTPGQFFLEMLPTGFAAQAEAGGPTPQGEFTLAWHLTGDGGGEWLATLKDGKMTTKAGGGDANVTFTLSVDDWRDAVLSKNGASIALILPQQRPGRPDNSARAKQLKGTIAQELARDGQEPFKVELCFNGAATPRTTTKMKLPDFIAMQEGRLNGQEAFMTGKMQVTGDMAFLMQIAMLMA
jgi:hypothetical protein